MAEKLVILVFALAVAVLAIPFLLAVGLPPDPPLGGCLWVGDTPADIVPLPDGYRSETLNVTFSADNSHAPDFRGFWREQGGVMKRVDWCEEEKENG